MNRLKLALYFLSDPFIFDISALEIPPKAGLPILYIYIKNIAITFDLAAIQTKSNKPRD